MTTSLRTRIANINTDEQEMQRMEAANDRAQTRNEETRKAEFRELMAREIRGNRPEPRQTVVGMLRSRLEEFGMRAVWMPSIRATLAKDDSANPGAVYLKTSNNEYIGKITRDGQLRTNSPLNPEQRNDLRNFVVLGHEFLATCGKQTGVCCYCGAELTDPESVERGYGPVCARKYGVEHSNRHGF